MTIAQLNDTTFAGALADTARPLLVDFYADWCGPCRALAPTLEQLAAEYAGKIRIAKINVDEAPRLAAQFGIRGVPTMIVFQAGKERDRITGALPKRELAAYLDSLSV